LRPDERNDFLLIIIIMNQVKPAIYLIKAEDSGVHGISLYCNGVGWTQDDAIELLWRNAHILLSLEPPETPLKTSALYFH
jgi:hypothetical protein